MSNSPIKKQALLIGINKYRNLPELKFARQDAEAVEEALKRNYGFSDDEVVLLTDAKPGLLKPSDKETILSHLKKLANQDLDLFVFGFWGHGLFCNGKRYLCPLDVTIESVEKQGFSFFDLQQLLTNIRAKNTCMILDCCQNLYGLNQTKTEYSGVQSADCVVDLSNTEILTSADQTAMEDAARDIGLRRMEKEPKFVSNVAILNSCKEGQSAYEWEDRQHGIFTAHLLDAMNCRCNKLFELVSYVSSAVEKTARDLGKDQTPFYKLEGDIVLPVVAPPKPLPRFIIETNNSADAVIQKPVIEDIDITVTPRIINQPQQTIQYNQITLPSKPKELLNLPVENEWLQDAIEQLKAFTHESLEQANDALAQAQAQFNAWTERREDRWKDLPESTRESWDNVISQNPNCIDDDVVQQNNLSNQQYLDILEKFQCGKKYQQAKLELERVERERKSKCDEAILKFQQKIEDNKRRYIECVNNFFDEVLMAVLGAMPGYKECDAQFPEEEIIAPLRQLDKYDLGWKASEEKIRARHLWNENRPCVIAERKRIEAEEKWNRGLEEWKGKLKIGFKYILLYLIVISLFILGVALFGCSNVTSESSPNQKFYYMLGSSGSIIIGLLLIIISSVYFRFGFDNDHFAWSIEFSYISLETISLFAMGIYIICYFPIPSNGSVSDRLLSSLFFLFILGFISLRTCVKLYRDIYYVPGIFVCVMQFIIMPIVLLSTSLLELLGRYGKDYSISFVGCSSLLIGGSIILYLIIGIIVFINVSIINNNKK